MGYISPQFHVELDKGLYSLQQEMLNSLWQVNMGHTTTKSKEDKKGSKSTRNYHKETKECSG